MDMRVSETYFRCENLEIPIQISLFTLKKMKLVLAVVCQPARVLYCNSAEIRLEISGCVFGKQQPHCILVVVDCLCCEPKKKMFFTFFFQAKKH